MERRPRRNIFYKILLFMEVLTLRRSIREASKDDNSSATSLAIMGNNYIEKREELKRII
jgi:hypothetical protein